MDTPDSESRRLVIEGKTTIEEITSPLMASQFLYNILTVTINSFRKYLFKFASELEREISDKGGEVLSVVEKNTSINIQLGDPAKLQEKTNFIQQLKTMLSSGVSLVQSLEIAVKQIENDIFKTAIEEVITDLQQGNSFSESKKHPKIFDQASVAMVSAGKKVNLIKCLRS